MPTKSAAPRKKTARKGKPRPGKKPPAKITKANLSTIAQELPATRIVALTDTDEGFTFFVLAQGTGQKQELWWHCGGCWQDSSEAKVAALEDVSFDFDLHRRFCPAFPYQAQITIVWADGHPPSKVRV